MQPVSFSRFTFEQDPDGRWYVVPPEYPGPRAELEMVMGADDLLSSLAAGENRVTLVTSPQPFQGFQGLLERQRLGESEGGAYYVLTTVFDQAGEVWLCDVLKWSMGEFPDKIFFTVSM